MYSKDKGHSLLLSVNAGSSSLKISVFSPNPNYSSSSSPDVEPVTLLLNASVENLTALPARFSFAAKDPGISKKLLKKEEVREIKDHESAFSYFVGFLAEHTHFHEGNITHILPDADSVAFFDSMFHATLPECVVKYAIDQSIANPKGLRKYGFHGISYSYILRSASAYLKKPTGNTTLIVMHLGSGASVCAIKDGKSIDTSMGLTPLDGLPGATRSGHVDASLIFHYTNQASHISRQAAEAVEITDAEEILNKNAGWNALAGTSDFSVIAERANTPEHPRETLAFDLLVDRILGYVGSYFLKLGGAATVDALVFSGGLGENSVQLRRAITDRCKCVGFDINDEENEKVNDREGIIVGIGEGRDGMKTLVCRTDEQLEMARQCVLRDKAFDI
ncbi:hypothetical protein M0805_001305 [Coniferiporia weirii]|nr:hypothetical protein M0805_001305 [Coniferiporia weirii]